MFRRSAERRLTEWKDGGFPSSLEQKSENRRQRDCHGRDGAERSLTSNGDRLREKR